MLIQSEYTISKEKFVRHNNQREKRTHRDIETSVLNESNATTGKKIETHKMRIQQFFVC